MTTDFVTGAFVRGRAAEVVEAVLDANGLGSKASAQSREGRGELKLVRLQPGSGELAKPRKDGEWGEGERKGPVAASEPSEASDTQHI